MTLLDFVIVALAADAITSAWFFGEIFDSVRGYFQIFKDKTLTKTEWFFGTLFTCIFCLPYHIAFWTVALLWLPGFLLPEPWQTMSRLPVYAFAVTTVIHFLQQVRPFEAIPEDVHEQIGGHIYTESNEKEGSSNEDQRSP